MTKLTAFSIKAVVKLLEILVRIAPFITEAIDLFKKKHDDPEQPAE